MPPVSLTAPQAHRPIPVTVARALAYTVADSPRVHIEMPQASPSATIPSVGGLVGKEGQAGSLSIHV